MVDITEIKKLDVSGLLALIDSYPWFGAARVELCSRMSGMGAQSKAQCAEACLYIPSREVLGSIFRKSCMRDYSDKDAEQLVKACLSRVDAGVRVTDRESRGNVRVVGGDYFTKEQYDDVRRETDDIFRSFAKEGSHSEYREQPEKEVDFYTETLAGIFEEQGYSQEAKDIYSKLSLRYPEKSAYFAALIKKIDNK